MKSSVRTLLTALPVGLAVLLIVVTLVPVIQTNEWWIRIWDYPRLQIAVVSGVVLVLLLTLALLLRRGWLWVLCACLAAAAMFQTWRILPYTPVWPQEMATAEERGGDRCTTILIANVLMENRQADRVREVLEREQPDTVFIVENDQWWSDQLASIAERYPSVVDQPQDNTYGLLFMTRLQTDDVELRFLTDEAIPSIRASMQLPSGDRLNFYGVHPKPPRVGQDTDLRDRELTLVAREIREHEGHAVVGGDLNDVAWSHTTRLFKRISQILDPRQGRGLYASFHAHYPLLRWPLDHLFATSGFEIARLAVLSPTGSDHFPVLAEFCLRADATADNQDPESMQGDDREEMQETLSEDGE